MNLRRLGLSVISLLFFLGLLSNAAAFAVEPQHHEHTHADLQQEDDAQPSEIEQNETSNRKAERGEATNRAADPTTESTTESTTDSSTESTTESMNHDSDNQSENETKRESNHEADEDSNRESKETDSTQAVEEHPTQPKVDLTPNAKSAILMDVDTGTIIYEKNIHERMPPASITKIMTLLLVMEALDQNKITLDEMVTASERAASMGGSQIFLEAGEQMSVKDLLKGVAMASGNDASVALAEKIAGSEEMFVQMMNEKAKELGLENTHFVNSNGLPAKDHYSSAHDIAVMSKELLKYEEVTQYTGKYQDYLRTETDNPFWLVNTNKLVRFYAGVDGLKTGYTSEAKFCLSATAKKDNLRVVAVVLGEPNTKTRNSEVASLFDYAFSQYTNKPIFKKGDTIGSFDVSKGEVNKVELTATRPYSVLLRKGEGLDNIRHELVLSEQLEAPIRKGEPIGKIVVYRGDEALTEFTLEAPQDVAKAGWWTLFKRSAGKLFFLGESS